MPLAALPLPTHSRAEPNFPHPPSSSVAYLRTTSYSIHKLMGSSSSKPASTTQATQSATTPGGTTTSRSDRQKCWESRDKYFGCLDQNGVVKPGDEGGEVCKSEEVEYGKSCARSWIEYFNQRRVIADMQKARLEQMDTQAKNAARK